MQVLEFIKANCGAPAPPSITSASPSPVTTRGSREQVPAEGAIGAERLIKNKDQKFVLSRFLHLFVLGLNVLLEALNLNNLQSPRHGLFLLD